MVTTATVPAITHRTTVALACLWCDAVIRVGATVYERPGRWTASLDLHDAERGYRCGACGDATDFSHYGPHAETAALVDAIANAKEARDGVTMRCPTCSTLIDVIPPTDDARCLDCDTTLTEYGK